MQKAFASARPRPSRHRAVPLHEHPGALLHWLSRQHRRARRYQPDGFSGWAEVYLEGRWYTMDARHNHPRIGRIVMGRGRDAANIPISTASGVADLVRFNVVTDQRPASAVRVHRSGNRGASRVRQRNRVIDEAPGLASRGAGTQRSYPRCWLPSLIVRPPTCRGISPDQRPSRHSAAHGIRNRQMKRPPIGGLVCGFRIVRPVPGSVVNMVTIVAIVTMIGAESM